MWDETGLKWGNWDQLGLVMEPMDMTLRQRRDNGNNAKMIKVNLKIGESKSGHCYDINVIRNWIFGT